MVLDLVLNAASEFTPDEKWIIVMIYTVTKNQKIDLHVEKKVELDVPDFAKRMCLSEQEAYKRILKAVEILYERSFSYTELTENGHEAFCMTRWIHQYSHSKVPDDYEITIGVTHFMIEYIGYISPHLESYILKDTN